MTAAADVVTRASPYKGLTPYTVEDALFFFGREDETRIIAANILASRLTLVYGASGVGKSSLLAAGVKRYLDELADESIRARGSPDCVTVAFPSDRGDVGRACDSWRDDPVESIATAVEQAVRALVPDAEPPPRTRDLAVLLEQWTERLDADVLLILDQFEEYFLYHGEEDGEGTLATGLPKILKAPELRANVLISIRDDAYALLDRFKGRIPSLYDNYLRVAHLRRAAARDAITEPVERYNRLVAPPGEEIEVESELTEAVLSQVQSGEVVLGDSGRGAVGGEHGEAGVETPFLQLVMERLWEEERNAGSRVLRLATLKRLGDADSIVRRHLDAAMADLSEEEQELAARVFGRLVTPSGSKIAHLASDLAAMESLPPARVKAMLERLAEARILRPVAPPPRETESRYEIFHDVLAPAVLDWRARWLHARRHAEAQRKLQADIERHEAERRAAEEVAASERTAARRLRRVAAVAVAFAVGSAITAVLAIESEREAREANRRVEASRLERNAGAALRRDPAEALTLAARLVRQERDADGRSRPESLALLRQAVRASTLLAVLQPPSGAEVGAGDFSADGGSALTISGDRIDTWLASGGVQQFSVRAVPGSRLLTAAYSSDGSKVVAGTDDGRTVLWTPPEENVKVLGQGQGPVVHVAFSAGGDRVISVTARDRAVRVWRLGRSKPYEFKLRARPTLALVDGAGERILVGTPGGAKLYDLATRRPDPEPIALRWPRREAQPARAAAFSPDGRMVIVGGGGGDFSYDSGPLSSFARAGGSGDAYASVWDARTGERLGHLPSTVAVTSVAFDDAGERLASGRADGVAQLWRLPGREGRKGRVLETLRGHTDQVSSVSFSPNGSWIVTGSRDGTARVWSARTGMATETLLGHGDAVATAAFNAGSSRILTVSDDQTARLWRVPDSAETKLRVKPNWFLSAGISPDGERALALAGNNVAKVVDIATGRTLSGVDRKRAWFAAFSADASMVLTADPNHIAAWNAETGERLAHEKLSVTGPPDAVPGGRWIAVGTERGIRMWDWAAGELGTPLPGSKGNYSDVLGLSVDGRHVARVRQRSGHLVVWDAETGERVWERDGVPSGTVAVSPDGSSVVVGATGGGAGTRATAVSATKLFTPGTREPLTLAGHDAVTVIRYTPDGSLILTAGEENTARVWSADGKRVATLRGHQGAISDAAFSPDGALVATASEDGTGRVWDPRSGEVLAEAGQEAATPGSTVAFTDAGRRFAIGNSDRLSIYGCTACGGETELLARADELRARMAPRRRSGG